MLLQFNVIPASKCSKKDVLTAIDIYCKSVDSGSLTDTNEIMDYIWNPRKNIDKKREMFFYILYDQKSNVVGFAEYLGKLAFEFSRRAVEHHQNGRRAKGPAAAGLDADGRAGHLAAGAAVQAAHGADVIVAEETHNEVALAQQVAAFFLGQLRVFFDGSQQQCLQLQHLRNLTPCEHPAHQHQNGKGTGL